MQVFLAIVFSVMVQASWTKLPSKDFPIDSPPSAAARKMEIPELLELQKNRDPADCALSRAQQWPTFKILYQGPRSPLTSQEVERFEPVLEKVVKLGERISDYHKERFSMSRPFSDDSRIDPCVERPTGNRSYPSGHATMGALTACVLAEALPKKSTALLAYGEFLGRLRNIVGVHYPSDVRAGQDLGKEICEALLKRDDFTKELAARR